jgi:hypothetical protein
VASKAHRDPLRWHARTGDERPRHRGRVRYAIEDPLLVFVLGELAHSGTDSKAGIFLGPVWMMKLYLLSTSAVVGPIRAMITAPIRAYGRA